MSMRDYYRQECELHTPVVTTDAGGAFSESFTKLRDFKGRIRLLQGRERVMNEKSGYDATHRLYCDRATISLRDRIKNGTSWFDVVSINYLNDEANHIEVDLKLVVDL